MHSDVDTILELVKEKTGYPATVSFDPDMSLHSKMQSASESSPVHVIFLNPKFGETSNYLVANQCAMLLIKWADPKRIPDFSYKNADLQSLISKLSPEMPATLAPEEFIKYFIQPLIHQLVSEPIQIMSAELLWKEFPGLKDEQISHMTADLREASACLAPKIKDATPKGIFERSIIMGSAYASWWSQMTGSQIALLPYKAMGFLDKGQELLDALNSIPAGDKERWPKVVDLWAARLDMAGFYRWSIRNQ